jgi:hypothetical protein
MSLCQSNTYRPCAAQALVKPLQTRVENRSRIAPLELHKPVNTNAMRHPPASPPTSTGGPPSSPPQSRLGRADTTPAPQRPRPDVLAIQQQIADSWLMCLVRRCAAAYFELSQYSCKKAMNLIDTLPGKVQGGSWSLCVFGRCFYELAEYGTVSRGVWSAGSTRDGSPMLKSVPIVCRPETPLCDYARSSPIASGTWNGSRPSSGTWTNAPNSLNWHRT